MPMPGPCHAHALSRPPVPMWGNGISNKHLHVVVFLDYSSSENIPDHISDMIFGNPKNSSSINNEDFKIFDKISPIV